MTDKQKTKQELIQEIDFLRQRVAVLEQSESERKRAEEELALSGLRIQALLDLHLLGAAPQEQFLDFALEASLRMTQSEFAFIGLMDEAESVMTIHRWTQEAMSECTLDNKPILYPIAEAGWWGDCVRKRKPVLVNDYYAPHPAKKGLPEGHVPIRRFLAVPIFEAGRMVAVAAVANKQGEYTDSDIGALTSLTNKLWELLRHKRAEEKLRESARMHQIILDCMPCVALLLRPKSREIVAMNAAAAKAGATLGKTCFGSWPRLAEPCFFCRASEVWATGEERHIAVEAYGSVWEAHWIPVSEDLYMHFAFDITERKRAEEALKSSENRYQQLVEQPFLGVHVHSQGQVLYMNQAGARILGAEDPSTFVGKSVFSFLHPDYHEIVKERIQTIHETGTFVPLLEEKYVRLDGKVIDVEIAASYHTYEGRPAVQIVFQDITERKQTEEALRKSQETAQQLAKENAVMAEIGRVISSSLNIEEIYERFADLVKTIISFDRIAIALINPKDHTATTTYVSGIQIAGRKKGVVYPLGGTITEEVLRARSSLHIQPKDEKEIEELSARVPSLLPNFVAGIRSAILVPLIAKDETIGVLNFQTTQTKAYTDQDVKLAESIAYQVAGAVASAQLYEEQLQAGEAARRSAEEAKKLAQENAVMAEIGRVISSSLNIEEVYDRFADLIKPFISFDRIAITFINPEDHTGTTTYISGIHMAGRKKGEAFSLAGSITEEVWRTRSILLLQPKDSKEIQEAIDRFPFFVNTVQAGFRSLMSVPLVSKNEVIGVLHLRSPKPNAYSEKDLRFCERVVIQISGTIANAQLFAERKRAEEALRLLSFRNEAILAAVPDIIMEVDVCKRYTWANQAGLMFFGEDVVGREASYYFEGEQATYNKVQPLFDGGEEVIYIESWQRRQDGKKCLLSWWCRVLKDEEGRVTGALSTGRDITERKQAEEEKRSLEERLQRSEKMEALGQLAGGVAHDLNNVLGIVVGYAEMLLMDADESSSIRPHLLNIMKGGQRAAAIVDDLLTLARRGVSGRDVLNLNKIIADCQQSPEFVNLSSYHPAVKIKADLDPDLLNISGSAVHFGKTLFNLVSNACEAMAKGGIVTMKTANQYLDKPIHGYDNIREGDYVVLSVSDTGEGIAANDLKRIFDPFYTKKVMGRSGTGLGLAVVWGTVKDHSGYLDVQSEEGKGSVFTLYFPITREEISAEAVAIAISEYMGKGESILVVDDVKEQRDLASSILKGLNYDVSSVSSGEGAVAYLKEHKVDLMVLDMIMDPGMDGLETYRSVLEIRPKQKAIIVSGFSESDRVHAAQSLGAGAYVRKPYIKEKLGLAVRKELDRSA